MPRKKETLFRVSYHTGVLIITLDQEEGQPGKRVPGPVQVVKSLKCHDRPAAGINKLHTIIPTYL